MTYDVFLIRIGMSFLLSFCIGLERQWRRRAIGLRTNVLVSIGAFLFVSFSVQTNAADMTRIAAQVVSGIGFLGAGIILKDGTNIRGLNTAATLWCNAAIGSLCAAGLLMEACIGTLLILFANIILRYTTQKLNMIHNKNQKYENYSLKVVCEDEKEIVIRTLISQSIHKEHMLLTNMESQEIEGGKIRIYATFQVSSDKNNLIEKLVNRIVMEPGIISSGWKKIDKTKNEQLDDDEM